MSEIEEFRRREVRKTIICLAICVGAVAAFWAFANGAAFILSRLP